MRAFLATSTAILLLAAPAAQAQILGGAGGGLGGALGGGIGGTLGGTLNGGTIGRSTIGDPMDSVESTTRGTVKGTGRASANKSVDRKSGKVHADGSADGSLTGSVGQTLSTPSRMVGTSGSASGSGSAAGAGAEPGCGAATGTLGLYVCDQERGSVGWTLRYAAAILSFPALTWAACGASLSPYLKSSPHLDPNPDQYRGPGE